METIFSRWPLFLMLFILFASSCIFIMLARKKYRAEQLAAGKAAKIIFKKFDGKFSIVAQFCAVMDEDTCPLCRALDGKIVELDHPDYAGFTPPLHPVLPGRTHTKCRCYWTYLSKNDDPVPWVNWGRPSRDLLMRFFAKDTWGNSTIPDLRIRQ